MRITNTVPNCSCTKTTDSTHQSDLTKRKGYRVMLGIDELMCQKKVLKKGTMENKTGTVEILNESDGYFSPNKDQLREIFYFCSMDMDNVNKYLNGEVNLLWIEEEDQLILGPTGELGKLILSRYKGEDNVEQRVKFLDNIGYSKVASETTDTANFDKQLFDN